MKGIYDLASFTKDKLFTRRSSFHESLEAVALCEV